MPTVYKLPGGAIQANTITTSQLQTTVVTQIQAGGGPKVKSLIYPGNDTAANTTGGQTVYLTGSGFAANAQVLVNGAAVPSQSFISASNISFTTPALSTGTYPVYAINPEDGGTAILYPGLLISGEPTWVTSAGSLSSSQDENSSWNFSLSTTGDTPITYALAAGNTLPSGITLAANGLISGTISSPTGNATTYTFSVVATDAQNQDSTRQFTVTTSTGEGVLFANNVLLIHADGTNNKNNHTFLDSSNNNLTITRSGNTSQGSFSPFSQTGWSNYFDGSGDYLTTPSSGQFAPTGDFTISMWFYPTSFAASYYVLAGSWSAGASDEWLIQYDNTGAIRFLTTTDSTFSSAGVVKLNQWNFLSVSRSGNTVTGYVNGSSFRSYTLTGTVGSASKSIYIGIQANGSSWPYLGYISNLRLVSGSAQSATPPTSASTAISGTSLLTCQSNRFRDASNNNFTITRNGDVSVQPFSPFAPTAEYSTANVGGSGYFDGSDYLSVTTSGSALDFGNGDWTCETWIYPTTTYSTTQTMIFGGPSTGQLTLRITDSELIIDTYNTRKDLGASHTHQTNTWAHLAFVRDGNTLRIYKNGVQLGSTSTSFTYNLGSFQIAAGSGLGTYTGYFSGTRVIKGQCLYPSGTTFTAPTSPPTNVANTQFLCNFTNAGIFDQTAKNVLETLGDAKVSTTQYKYGTASMYFDGTGDWLDVVENPIQRIGTGDFTIETWVYTTTDTGYIFSKGFGAANGYAGWIQTGNVRIRFYDASGTQTNIITTSNPISTNTWYHIAFVRSSNTVTIYVNGNSVSNGSFSGDINSTSKLRIGANWDTAPVPLNGYLDDFRITRGYARYTSNFTPPSSAFKDK